MKMKDPNYRLTEQELTYETEIIRHIEELGCPEREIIRTFQHNPKISEQLREESRYHNEYWNVTPYIVHSAKKDNNR